MSICNCKNSIIGWLFCNIYVFHLPLPLLWCSPIAPTEPLCQPIIHLMLMTRCQLYCPTDIMPEDWCIDRARLIRAGMIQQHYMIYSGSNILRQDCPLGLGCLGPVYFHHPSEYQALFTDYIFVSSEARSSDTFHLHWLFKQIPTQFVFCVMLSIVVCFYFLSLTVPETCMNCILWIKKNSRQLKEHFSIS